MHYKFSHCRENCSVLEWALSGSSGGETQAWEKSGQCCASQESVPGLLMCCSVAASSRATSKGSETLGLAGGGEAQGVWSRLVLTAGSFRSCTCPYRKVCPLRAPSQVGLRSNSGLSGERGSTGRRHRACSGGPGPSGPAVHTPGLRLPWLQLMALHISR